MSETAPSRSSTPPLLNLAGADFHDTFSIGLRRTDKSALALYLDAVSRTPRWIEAAMALRNRVVSLVGLKNLGPLGRIDRDKPASSYRPGERLGIFSILSLTPDEVVLGDTDKHLRATIHVRKEAGEVPRLLVTTVVHVNRLFGHIYLFFVVPVHRRIVPAMLERIPDRCGRPKEVR